MLNQNLTGKLSRYEVTLQNQLTQTIWELRKLQDERQRRATGPKYRRLIEEAELDAPDQSVSALGAEQGPIPYGRPLWLFESFTVAELFGASLRIPAGVLLCRAVQSGFLTVNGALAEAGKQSHIGRMLRKIPFIKPMAPTLAKVPPAGPDWLH